ncbi:MAG: hypothetical protein ACXQTY_07140 [Candidatus Methanogasteraceae archaeon]
MLYKYSHQTSVLDGAGIACMIAPGFAWISYRDDINIRLLLVEFF